MQNRHIVASARGGPEALRVAEDPAPSPGPGEALVRVTAAGVSYGDVLQLAGVIPGTPKPPYVPGYDITGVVAEVGPGVDGVAPGQPVTALVREGGYASLASVPADRLVPVPPGTEDVPVAGAVLNYFIAYQMLHRVARAQPGQHVLVHGAAGGVGIAVLQLCRLAGIECHGTASAGKHPVVREHGGHPIDYRKEDFALVARDLPAGGFDAVLDPIGGYEHWRRSYIALRKGGILIAYGQNAALRDGKARSLEGAIGFLGGLVVPKLIPDGKSTIFYNAWSLEKSHPEAYREDLSEVLWLLANGEVKPVIDQTLPLPEAARAHELLEERKVVGKIVLTVGD